MGISQKDIKILWGRSGNRCVICKKELTQNSASEASSFTLGEQAHIVGENPGSARYQEQMGSAERNSYHNLILLCPNHHREIDSNPNDWTTEKLFVTKSQHELWVSEMLSEKQDSKILAENTAIGSIIDNTVEKCDLINWTAWTNRALSADPKWKIEQLNNIDDYGDIVLRAIWPDEYEELKYSCILLCHQISSAASVFTNHCIPKGEFLYPDKFYKRLSYNPNYDRDLKKYEEWRVQCYHYIYEATKAANWFADVVRRDVNPMFFIEQGKFLISQSSGLDYIFDSSLIEYSNKEKQKFIESKLDIIE